jgi:hypothetical protein
MFNRVQFLYISADEDMLQLLKLLQIIIKNLPEQLGRACFHIICTGATQAQCPNPRLANPADIQLITQQGI